MLYIIGILFAIGGIGIRFFKWDFLISGYNTMNEEEKSNVDIEKIRKLIGNLLILISIILFISRTSYNVGKFLIILILPIIIFVLIRAQKYDSNKRNNKSIKYVILFIIVVILGALFIYSSKGPKVNIMDDRIVIEGMFGTAINRDKIQEITLEDQIPKVKGKIIGLDLGNILRGTFDLEDMGTVNLFVNYNKSPYVVIKADDKYFIINFKDSDKTIELYNSLK